MLRGALHGSKELVKPEGHMIYTNEFIVVLFGCSPSTVGSSFSNRKLHVGLQLLLGFLCLFSVYSFVFLCVFWGLSTSSQEPVLDFGSTRFSDPGKAFVDASGMAHIWVFS